MSNSPMAEPRDFCGGLNLCYEMEHQLDLMGLGDDYATEFINLFPRCSLGHFAFLRLQPELRVDAALRAVTKAGVA